MTVRELIEALQRLEKDGHGTKHVRFIKRSEYGTYENRYDITPPELFGLDVVIERGY